MTSSQGSDISLPSPDRVANLWRFGESPTKAQAFSEEEGENDTIDARGQAGARTYDDEQQLGTNIATPGHGVGSPLDNAEAGGGVDVNLQEREVSPPCCPPVLLYTGMVLLQVLLPTGTNARYYRY